MSAEMALVVSAVALFAGAFVIHQRTASFGWSFFSTALLAVIISALSWVSYEVVILPVLLWIVLKSPFTWPIWILVGAWVAFVLIESWILGILGGSYPPVDRAHAK